MKMSKNVYEMIYSKLQQIGILYESGKMQAEYMKFVSEGLMDLNVDNLLNDMIALAHNGIQNGDVMADPDVHVKYIPKRNRLKLLHSRMAILAYIKRCTMKVNVTRA